jgi:prephenate dehydratase
MIQLHKRPLLYSGHITPRDPQILRNLPLRPLFPAGVQAEAAYHDFLLPLVQNIEVSESFVKRIPALVLSGFEKNCHENIDIIFHHPATTYLLSEITTSYKENITVSSNPESCRMVIKNISHSIAITNQLCADHYGLTTYKVLRKGINMPWVCFTRKLGE